MKRLIFSLVACITLAFLTFTAPIVVNAQSMHTLQALADAAPNSEVFAGQALWISFTYAGFPQYPQYASAVRLNKCWGLTAGHVIKNDSGFLKENFKVGVGPNWMTNAGITRKVSNYYPHPTWDGTWDGTKVDLAVVRFAAPLTGTDLGIGTLSLGDIFEYVGYATPATPDTGLLPIDGQRRVFDAKANTWGSGSGSISTSFVRSKFEQPGQSGYLAMGAVGTGGGSGSGGINAAGKLAALLVYGTGSPGYAGAATYGVRLELFKDWIESYTSDLSCMATVSKHVQLSMLAWDIIPVALD